MGKKKKKNLHTRLKDNTKTTKQRKKQGENKKSK